MKSTYLAVGLSALTTLIPSCKEDTPGGAMTRTAIPVASIQVSKAADDPTVRDSNVPDPRGEATRAAAIEELTAAGFKPASWLPTAGHRAGVPGRLRPVRDIAARLVALQMVSLWVLAPERAVPSAQIKAYIERNGLEGSLTASDRDILALSRSDASARHGGTIGWRQENMWALAWLLGFEPAPKPVSPLVSDDVVDPLVRFLPQPAETLDAFVARAKPRGLEAAAALEDMFYCAHNAVRTAQGGRTDAVPKGFDPILNGGAVHERRHALTWALSPGVAWDDTDLST